MAFVNSNGLDIYYEVHGSGDEVMILAHGMGGNAAIWFNQIAHFQDRYKIIVFDHRYFARSHCPVDEFLPRLFPEDAMAIMDAEGIEAAVWICQSMGGWTGSQLAVHHADRVKALVMSHTPGIFQHESALNDSRRLAETIKSGFLPALAADFPTKNPPMSILYGAISQFNNIENAQVSKKIGEAKLGVDIEGLEDYKIPTLFVTGDKDVLFDAGYIEALALALGAEFMNLGDVGHSSYFELPDAFNASVDTFLSAL